MSAIKVEGEGEEKEDDNNIKKNTVLRGKKILVATGAKPMQLNADRRNR
jgi:pyruvate/2-oxoglutarate dehydrogenase complex dihydrolipoamide dehydrogenase (E3) component